MKEKTANFIMYPDYKEAFKALPGDDVKALLLSLFDFAETGECIELPPSASMAFLFISQQIKRDQEKYLQVCESRKEAGKKGGRPKKTDFDTNQTQAKKANGFSEKQKNQTQAKEANNNYKDNCSDKDNTKKDIVGKKPTPPYKAIIDYLNEKTNSRYKHTTKSTQRIINGRFDDGFTLEDFKIVIDVKSSQWLGDKKMAAYLRPETLFAASHFESYLNECRLVKPQEPKHSGISEKLARETSDNLLNTDDCGEFM